MRILHDHKVNPANEALTIEVHDEPGAGGASHLYIVRGFDASKNPSSLGPAYQVADVLFQNGPIPETGVNGLTHEVLLAIVADRLRSFQQGAFACTENALALQHVCEALFWLKHRTLQRTVRGVEGTHTV